MKNQYFTIEVKVAITAIIAIAFLFFGMKFLKGLDLFKSTHTYYIVFSDVTGLSKSNPVYAGGYAVGNVKDIYYDYSNPGKIVVQVELAREMKIPRGTTAELATSMLGGASLNLIFSSNPLQYLHRGDTIRGGKHLGAIDKAEAMIPAFEKMLPKLDSILSSVNYLVSNPALNNTLENADNISKNLDVGSKQLAHLLSNDVPQLTASLYSIEKNAERFSSKMADLDLQTTIDSVNMAIAQVNRLSATIHQKINSRDNSLGMLLNSRSLYDSLTTVSNSANMLLRDLKNRPKRYVHFSVFGKKEK